MEVGETTELKYNSKKEKYLSSLEVEFQKVSPKTQQGRLRSNHHLPFLLATQPQTQLHLQIPQKSLKSNSTPEKNADLTESQQPTQYIKYKRGRRRSVAVWKCDAGLVR
jgi:hypothetical protein